MIDLFAFTDSAAESTAETVSNLTETLTSDIHDIDGHVSALAGSWEGPEYDTYKHVEAAWASAAANAASALGAIRSLIDAHKTSVGHLKDGINQALDA